ncbi:G-protein coupled receptor moody-like [Pecten maximus]|uniref:G-protein coupled receptor moody-like n=1 Tax=Pecten maximus TaxID=6579 RepID=UPI0014581AE7|nr:G-protein coupled receptor moody-like [Pecten maximus]
MEKTTVLDGWDNIDNMEQTTVLDGWDNITSDEDIPTRTLHQVGATLIGSLGFIANTIILIAILKAKLYRQNVILFVLNLVINNTLACATSLPYIATMAFNYTDEVDLVLCRVMGYITYSITASELLGLDLVAVNRYFLIVRYSTYLQIYNDKKNIGLMILMSWIIYPTMMLFPATDIWGSLLYDQNRFICHPFKANDSFGKFLVGFALLTSVPLLILGYTSILPKVFWSKKQVNRTRSRSVANQHISDKPRRRDVRLVSLVIVLLTTFCLMYLPFAVISIIDAKGSKYDPRIHVGLIYVAWTHCLVNPFLYALMNRQIQKAIKDLFLGADDKDAISGVTTINRSKTETASINTTL